MLIAGADYLTGRDIYLNVAYAIPISLSAWFVGRAGASLVLLSALIAEAAADAGFIGLSTLLANALIHGVLYGFLLIVLDRLSHLQRNLERRAQQRALALDRETAMRRRLERDVIEISEREQRRVGRDLHDGLCQHLLGTAVIGQALAEKLESAHHSEAAGAARIVNLVQQAVRLTRGMARGLYPVGIEKDGLMHALEEFCLSSSEMFRVNCRFDCQAPVLIRDQASAIHLYRIAQEAVCNAIRHGRATEICVLLDESESGIVLEVTDNGIGDAASPLPQIGMGLKSIADRARMLGGHHTITPGPHGGMKLRCLVPDVDADRAPSHA